MGDTIHDLAAGQHGVFTRRQALEAGLSRSAITHRVDKGLWVAVNRYVFQLP